MLFLSVSLYEAIHARRHRQAARGERIRSLNFTRGALCGLQVAGMHDGEGLACIYMLTKFDELRQANLVVDLVLGPAPTAA